MHAHGEKHPNDETAHSLYDGIHCHSLRFDMIVTSLDRLLTHTLSTTSSRYPCIVLASFLTLNNAPYRRYYSIEYLIIEIRQTLHFQWTFF